MGPGVTCVVGPNGAGKSNILEALRWVMGEQRVRTLRSRKMEDVIFNGSETLKPVGLAEVRLVLSNLQKTSNSAYNDYDEIMVSRRLFRDGASHYEINNIPCRLSDITDFFLDTGVGKNSYAIIEQGRVEQIVAAKPEERRILIEEAAGVNKYKARKEAALKKLESTSQNLLRLSDIILEVKTQSLSLKRQSQKAERYQKLLDQLRILEVSLIAGKVQNWNQKLVVAQKNVALLNAELQTAEVQLMEKNALLEKNKLDKLKAENQHRDLLEKKHNLELSLGANRETTGRTSDRLNDVRTRIANIETELILTAENRDLAKGNLDLVKETLTQATDKLVIFREQLDQSQKKHSDLTENISAKRKQFNNLRDELFRSLQDSALTRNKKEGLVKRKTEYGNQLARKKSERATLAREIEAARENIKINETELISVAARLADVAQTQTGLSTKKSHLETQIKTTRLRLQELEKKFTISQTRLRTLEELQDNYGGYGNSIKLIMKNRNRFGDGLQFEPIGEIIDVPEMYHKALAATLRDRIDMVVAPSVLDSVVATERLRSENVGRASFVPVNPRLIGTDESANAPKDATSMMDVITVRPGFQNLANFLFREVFIVQDLRKAMEIWGTNGASVDLVTLDGDFLSRHGEVSGGSREVVGEEIFKRRQEINLLSNQLAGLHAELDTARISLGDEEQDLAQTRKHLHTASEEINRLKMAELKLQAQKDNLGAILSNGVKQMGGLEIDENSVERETRQIDQELELSNSMIETLNQKTKKIESEKDRLQSQINILHQKNSDQLSAMESLKIQSAKLNERVRASDREIQSVQEKISQSDQQLVRLNSEKQKASELEKQLLNEIKSLELQEIDLMRSHQESASEVQSLQSMVASSQDACLSLEKEVGEFNRTVRIQSQKIHELELESARLEENVRNAIEKIREQYQIDLNKFEPDVSGINETELELLRGKITSFGPVNLAAITESKAVDERLEFLRKQEADLKNAVDTLHQTIDTINQTTRERFMATFENVNQKFREIFPFLFGGGQAQLELTDFTNPLETGVSIMVRPPGKRYQNMDLLSGGEKALTAVALIFSIFLTSPSPFCLLDEVDAPLDDSNLSRFNQMLRKLSEKTQFIVVTHNKRSMEESDSLFGVTMEEPGASKVVSVKFLN